jgi:arylsulfatase A-like enzyme
MLGDFGLYGKRLFYEGSSRIPLIVVGRVGDERITPGSYDNRIVALQDIMPTLLDLAGVPIPKTCDGQSIIGSERRTKLYGEVLENHSASRMLHDGRYKLIWYPAGNHLQLFDLETDPNETCNLSDSDSCETIRDRLCANLAAECYGKDMDEGWVKDGTLVGYDPGPYIALPDRTFSAQRGLHYPQPPEGTVPDDIGFPV